MSDAENIIHPPIEKGIPVPDGAQSRIAHLMSMEPGDSFPISLPDRAKWQYPMNKCMRTGDRHYISRTVDGELRIWRVS